MSYLDKDEDILLFRESMAQMFEVLDEMIGEDARQDFSPSPRHLLKKSPQKHALGSEGDLSLFALQRSGSGRMDGKAWTDLPTPQKEDIERHYMIKTFFTVALENLSIDGAYSTLFSLNLMFINL